MAGPLRELLDHQIALIEAGDLEGLLAQYHQDAVLLRFDTVVRGHAALREFFTGYLAARPRVERLDAFAEADDVLSYQATLTTTAGRVRAYGVFQVQDGRIRRQIAGMLPS